MALYNTIFGDLDTLEEGIQDHLLTSDQRELTALYAKSEELEQINQNLRYQVKTITAMYDEQEEN